MIRNRTFHIFLWWFYGSLTLLRACMLWEHIHLVTYGQLYAASFHSQSRVTSREEATWIYVLAWIRLYQHTLRLLLWLMSYPSTLFVCILGIILFSLYCRSIKWIFKQPYYICSEQEVQMLHSWKQMDENPDLLLCPATVWDSSMVLSQLCAFLQKPVNLMLRRTVLWCRAFFVVYTKYNWSWCVTEAPGPAVL